MAVPEAATVTTVEAADALWRWRQADAEPQFSPQVLLISEMPLEGVAYLIGGSSLPSNLSRKSP